MGPDTTPIPVSMGPGCDNGAGCISISVPKGPTRADNVGIVTVPVVEEVRQNHADILG